MSLTKEHEQFIKEWIEDGNFKIKHDGLWCTKQNCKDCKLLFEICHIARYEYTLKYYPECIL